MYDFNDGMKHRFDPVKPMSPKEVALKKGDAIPPYVYAAVNLLLAKGFTNSKSEITITLKEIERLTRQLIQQDGRHTYLLERDFYEEQWFNIEEVYRVEGWKVGFSKPDYTESFPSYFTFKAA